MKTVNLEVAALGLKRMTEVGDITTRSLRASLMELPRVGETVVCDLPALDYNKRKIEGVVKDVVHLASARFFGFFKRAEVTLVLEPITGA